MDILARDLGRVVGPALELPCDVLRFFDADVIVTEMHTGSNGNPYEFVFGGNVQNVILTRNALVLKLTNLFHEVNGNREELNDETRRSHVLNRFGLVAWWLNSKTVFEHIDNDPKTPNVSEVITKITLV